MRIAIITARGGSKRIPYKNIKDFCGKPIITYVIEAAIDSGLFDEVMVSTDDEKIAAVSQKHGAKIPFMRSATASNDFATTADALLEVLDCYKKRGKEFSELCCIYPTAVFATADKLRNAMNIFEETNADAVLPVVAFAYPPLRGLVIEDNRLRMKWPDNYTARSQDLQTIYHDSGQFYILRTSALLSEKTVFCKNAVPIIVPEIEVQDIDNEDDWKLAELKYKMFNKA